MVHVAHEIAVPLCQGMKGAVDHGDDSPRHAWLVSVAGEQSDEAFHERGPCLVGRSLLRRRAEVAGDTVAVRPGDVGEHALDATAVARLLHRSSEKLGSELVAALGHADGDLACRPAIPLGRSTRARSAAPGRAAVANLEQIGVHQLVEVERGNRARHAERSGDTVAAQLAIRRGSDVLVDAPAKWLVQRGQRGQRVGLGLHGLHSKTSRS